MAWIGDICIMKSKYFLISLIIIGLLLISLRFTVDNASAFSHDGVFLIKTSNDWERAGFDLNNTLYDYPVYIRYSLIDFYMPIALKKEDVSNLKPSDVSHVIMNGNKNFSDRLVNIGFNIMESSSYYVVVYFMKVKASNNSFHVDFVPKIKGEELNQYAWWDSDWKDYKMITINHDFVDNDLTNFPIYINMDNDNDLTKCQSDGDDIVFVSIDNTTKFNHEIEYFFSFGPVYLS